MSEKGACKTLSLEVTERKRMEEALKRSNEFAKTVLERINEGICLIDVHDFRILGVNSALLKQLGLKQEEVIGKTCYELTHHRSKPCTGPDHVCPLSATVASGKHSAAEHVHYRADGEKIDVEVSTSPVKDENGKVVQVVHVARDITERKRMEKELTESEERYRNLVQSAPDVIYTVSLDGTVTSLNPAFETITGWARSEWIGKQFTSLVHPDDLPLAMALFQNAIQEEVAGALEARILAKSGEYLLVEVRATPLTQNERVVGFWGIARDITERKRMEEEMRVKDSAIASSINAIAMADLEGNLTYVNDSFLKMWGYDDAKEVLGKPAVKFWQAEEKASEVVEILKARGYWVGELVAKRKDGSLFDTYLSTSMVIDEAGKPICKMASFVDITERKRMEEQLVRSKRLAAIGQLAGGVGHELRNPLGAIKNAAYYVKGKVAKSELAQKEPRVMEFLDIMDDEIDSSNKIINDLLGFSRVGKPSVSPTQIKKVIEDALLGTTIPENIKLSKKLDTELPQVEIDASQIHQVLVNMILNAVQAMPEGGKLTIGAKEVDKFLEVEIADTGCGIPQEAIDKLFDPLFTTKAKGIGLGLAVCKAIIDRHEGNIEVKSQAGKGTTFTIKLPLKAEYAFVKQ